MIYLDNAATSYPKPEEVYIAVDQFHRKIGASPGRGTYSMARKADEILFETRSALAKLFSIADLTRIIFTLNVTESINLALKGFLNEGDHVITTSMEHNAVWRPLKRLEREKNIEISVVDCPDGKAFSIDRMVELIKPGTRLAIINHASNVTGTLMPVKEVGRVCKENSIPLLVDAAQTAGVVPIDVREMQIDLLAFTGHKGLMGPSGTGGLYIAEGIELQPLKEGGTGSESLLEHQPFHLPDRFEAGTLNIAGIAGLGASVKYILNKGIDEIREHEMELTEYALKKIYELPNIIIYGPVDNTERTSVISFNFSDIAPEEVTYVLDEVYNIMARSGLHCAPQAHKTIGTVDGGTVRIGFGYFNNKKEINLLIGALTDIVKA